ncbi:hypothetical protein DY000_02007709 [Brassica cretica]|uniref:Uncharacterized protein n=1 Tax=Brassica cretica TaxID=69181 RepID=A0ABQ7C9F2_BRACR|nr:hypothetical protein DY000_02007709 [Brassica cretica]
MDRSTRRQEKWTSHTQLAQRRVRPINPTRCRASWMHQIQLAQQRVGSTKSNSPLGELDVPSPTRPMASWISLVQIYLFRVRSVPHHAFSCLELPTSGLDQAVSYFVSIGVIVETLR